MTLDPATDLRTVSPVVASEGLFELAFLVGAKGKPDYHPPTDRCQRERQSTEPDRDSGQHHWPAHRKFTETKPLHFQPVQQTQWNAEIGMPKTKEHFLGPFKH